MYQPGAGSVSEADAARGGGTTAALLVPLNSPGARALGLGA